MKRKELSPNDAGILILLMAVIFGAWFRIMPAWRAGFPINDGGLFHSMIEALQKNHYHLPEYVLYNGLEIPFAYPPLAFYAAGAIADIFHAPLVDILLWFPAAVSIAAIPAVFWLAEAFLGSRLQAGLAALFYALLPRSLTWFIMGGGVTRAPGQLFLILATLTFYLLFTRKKKKYLLPAILCASLVCLTHPEAALHTAGIALLLWIFYGRNRDGIIHALAAALGTLLLTLPWWLTILLRFGPDPYLSAAQTGLHGANALVYFLISFSEEPYLTPIAVLGILGLAVKIARREFLLPLWYAIPFLMEPRNAPNVSVIPMALLASTALLDMVFPFLAKLEGQSRKMEFQQSLQSRIEKVFFLYLALIMLTGMYTYHLALPDRKVSLENRQAFQWVASNTPAGGHFLVVTGNTNLFADWTLEWFPALTKRVNETTIQGYEWLDGKRFLPRVINIQLLQNCVNDSAALACVEKQADQLGAKYDYIYVARKTAREDYATTLRGDALILELTQSKNFMQIYRSEEISIFKILR